MTTGEQRDCTSVVQHDGGVYAISNVATGAVYIGCTCDFALEDTAIAARVHVAIVRGGWHTTSDITAHVHMYPAERVARVVQLMAEHHLLYADESVWPVRYQLKS